MSATPSRSDAPALLLMAAIYLAFGLFAILRPDVLRTAMDNFANYWKPGSWHPYKMPHRIMQFVVGGVGTLGAILFSWMAWVALH